MTNDERLFDRLWAAFIFFTRLPLWRLHEPPAACYRSVVEWWPLAGWLTGGVMAGVLYGASLLLPWTVAVLLAVCSRMLLTGALHEDGLADFLDGMGGGADRRHTLDIMKDSHIGTYGVLGLLLYVLLFCALLCSLPHTVAVVAVVAADPYAKMLTSQLVAMMPYARAEQEAKARVVYRRPSVAAGVGLAVQGLLPMAVFVWQTGVMWTWIVVVPALVMYGLSRMVWHRLHGYTGDCCGAVCLLTELSFYVALAALM